MPTPLDYATPIPRPPGLPWPQIWPTLRLALILIPLECFCLWLAYHTIGEVISGFLTAVMVVLNAPAVAAVWTHPRTARAVLLLVALLIIPCQLYLGLRWWRVAREADQVVAHVRSTIAQTGRPPPDLSAYRFSNPAAQPFIAYRPDGRSFNVSYWVATPSTAHTYSPATGWFYYPD